MVTFDQLMPFILTNMPVFWGVKPQRLLRPYTVPFSNLPVLTLVSNATCSPSFLSILVSFINSITICQCSTSHVSGTVLGMSMVNNTDTLLPSWTSFPSLAPKPHHIPACPPFQPYLLSVAPLLPP